MQKESSSPAGARVVWQGKYQRLLVHEGWEYCERCHGGDGMAVIVVAVTPADEVLFVEQYRVPLQVRTIEMPAGLVGDDHDDDSLEAAAVRELIEETGWKPGRVDVLLTGPTSSGMSNERIAFVACTAAGEGRRRRRRGRRRHRRPCRTRPPDGMYPSCSPRETDNQVSNGGMHAVENPIPNLTT